MLRLTALALLVLALASARVARAADAPVRRTAAADPTPLPAPPPAGAASRSKTQRVPRAVRAVEFARRLLGARYRYGGTSPRTGFDCSGFVRFVYAHVGVRLPRVSYEQFGRGRRVSRRALRPGDLVFFSSAGHVGIYVGHGRFIHAPHSGTVVSIDSLRGSYGRGYDGARRVA